MIGLTEIRMSKKYSCNGFNWSPVAYFEGRKERVFYTQVHVLKNTIWPPSRPLLKFNNRNATTVCYLIKNIILFSVQFKNEDTRKTPLMKVQCLYC